jgi:Tat protein translocase TatB subunit
MFDFGLSYSHILVIVIVAVVAIGPKDLPVVLRKLGQFMNKVRSMGREFQGHVDVAMRDAGVADLKKDLQNLKSGIDADMKTSAELLKPSAPAIVYPSDNGFNAVFGADSSQGETRVAGRGVAEQAL